MSPANEEADIHALIGHARGEPAVDPARTARVRAAVHAAWIESRAARATRARWLMAGAAAAALVLAYLVSGIRPDEPGNSAPAGAARVASVRFVTGDVRVRRQGSASDAPLAVDDLLDAGAVVITGPDGRLAVRLTDGVEVRIDRGTRVAAFPDGRIALEQGAVYIDTTGRDGPGTPIEVRARGAMIRDIGTRFEVRLSADPARVRVREGRVEVKRGADSREAPAGTAVTLGADGLRLSASPVFGDDWAWIVRATEAPQLDGRRLSEFLAWVEREGGRQVRFADRALERASADTIVYGDIDGLTVEEALDVVLPTCGLTHRIDGAVITIVAAGPAAGARR